MQLSTLIKELQKQLAEHGDVNCFTESSRGYAEWVNFENLTCINPADRILSDNQKYELNIDNPEQKVCRMYLNH